MKLYTRMLLIGLWSLIPTSPVLATLSPTDTAEQPAKSYRLHTIAVVRNRPDGPIIDIWDRGTPFTSGHTDGDWLQVTGHFPDDRWEPAPQPMWISRYYARTFTPQVVNRTTQRPASVQRYIRVNKSSFRLEVIERQAETEKVIFATKVALGMDRCLPREKGGRCYYTEPGEYKVRWKVHDPKGIEWCIPKSMEQEYPQDIASNKRCFRGPLGQFALNIGKSYAIHGTNRPQSLGRRVSHGCVRAANDAMKRLYQMMDVGDRVIITD